MPVKVIAQVFIESERDEWIETLYSDEFNALKDGLDAISALAVLRYEMLAAGARVTQVRVSDLDIVRDSLVNTIPPPAKSVLTGFPSNQFNTVLLRMEAGSLYRRAFYVSGQPNVITVPLGSDNTSNQWYAKYAAWKNALLHGTVPWKIRALSKESGDLPKPVTAVANDGAHNAYVTVTAAAHGMSDGDQVRLTFNKTLVPAWQTALGGISTVFFKTANTFDVAGSTPIGIPLIGNVTYQPQKHIFASIDAVQIMRMTRHKRGGSAGGSKGKRPTKKS